MNSAKHLGMGARCSRAAISLLLVLTAHSWAVAQTAPAQFLNSAAIEIRQSAAFVQLDLPAETYARSRRNALEDLRIVDAQGERVPFALLPLRAAQIQETEQQRAAVPYPLPRKPADGSAWPSPVEVQVQGERITVRRRGGTVALAPGGSPGWLFDLGVRAAGDPAPRALRISWSGPAEFSATFDLETSDDLCTWRPAGSGQLMALSSAGAALTQPDAILPATAGRFVRLVWADPTAAPVVTDAKAIVARQDRAALDPPTELKIAASTPPLTQGVPDELAARALHFDLGGALPITQIDLQLPPGTRVAPVRVQGRTRLDEPWRDLTQAVFYRLERASGGSTSPAVAMQARVRYLRLVPDERAAKLDAAGTTLVVHARLASLVFAAQGQAPFRLLAGADSATPNPLPIATLVPGLDEERARFGKAVLGPWSEVAEAARQIDSQQRQAALRPWLLWSVLLAGVAGLGFMVWRLAQGRGAPKGEGSVEAP